MQRRIRGLVREVEAEIPLSRRDLEWNDLALTANESLTASVIMDNPLSSDSSPANLIEPFTMVALARQDLSAGEMVHFDVDSAGKITSTNFLFVPTTPRVTKMSDVMTVTVGGDASTTQSETSTSDPAQGATTPPRD